MEDLKLEDINFEYIATAQHLHFSSIFLQAGIRHDLTELFKKAKSIGLTTSLDPQWDPAEKWEINIRELLPYIDVFMPNITEFQLLTSTNSLKDGIALIKQFAPILMVVVKDGSNGAFGWNGVEWIHQPAILNENPVDCIGAGDSFNAGFIHRFTKGYSLKQCLEYGALTGAVSTTAAGGTGAFSNLKLLNEMEQHVSLNKSEE
jgi:sugar/nucleoside kinase (ribokinase family)